MDAVHTTLHESLKDYCEHMPEELTILTETPSAAEFLTNHVLPSTPFILKSGGKGYFSEARRLWQTDYYLKEAMGNAKVTVAVTPDGKADWVVDDKFMVPEKRTMSFSSYMRYYKEPNQVEVYSVQRENDNLNDEFSPLLPLLARDVPWATEAFSGPPDEANIWMGDEYSFTSTHKQLYDNIFFVVRGKKTFRLFPPVATAWMPYKKYPKYQWHFDGSWRMRDLKEEVSWIEPDLQAETPQKFKMFLDTMEYTETVYAGEALYIPAMWFHDDYQTNETIAVNYLYDTPYERRFPFLNLVEKLANLHVPRQDASVDTQTELVGPGSGARSDSKGPSKKKF